MPKIVKRRIVIDLDNSGQLWLKPEDHPGLSVEEMCKILEADNTAFHVVPRMLQLHGTEETGQGSPETETLEG